VNFSLLQTIVTTVKIYFSYHSSVKDLFVMMVYRHIYSFSFSLLLPASLCVYVSQVFWYSPSHNTCHMYRRARVRKKKNIIVVSNFYAKLVLDVYEHNSINQNGFSAWLYVYACNTLPKPGHFIFPFFHFPSLFLSHIRPIVRAFLSIW
jgi:hypothetical protein